MARRAPIDPAFREAAVHVAQGCSLEAAAREGGVGFDELKAYRSEHPDTWERFVRVERLRCFGLACSEAILVLRKLMRSADKTIALKAAASLNEVRVALLRHGKACGAGR